jgi:HTH-type transcriptional regulator/antitoxin HipB
MLEIPSMNSERTTATEEVGRLLRARRKQLGLSQQDVALSIGANRMSVSAVERGLPGVRLGTALAIATALGLDVRFPARGEDA